VAEVSANTEAMNQGYAEPRAPMRRMGQHHPDRTPPSRMTGEAGNSWLLHGTRSVTEPGHSADVQAQGEGRGKRFQPVSRGGRCGQAVRNGPRGEESSEGSLTAKRAQIAATLSLVWSYAQNRTKLVLYVERRSPW
jgi:hypothetical protein